MDDYLFILLTVKEAEDGVKKIQAEETGVARP